jgi:hypothetical protein
MATTTPTPAPSALATRRGKLILGLLTMVAFLDFVTASIVNVALPSIRSDLHSAGRTPPDRPEGEWNGLFGRRLLSARWELRRLGPVILLASAVATGTEVARASTDGDGDVLDCVVAHALVVPRRLERLAVAGGVGGPASEVMLARGGVPVE